MRNATSSLWKATLKKNFMNIVKKQDFFTKVKLQRFAFGKIRTIRAFFICFAFFAAPAFSFGSVSFEKFKSPEEEYKPWCYWWWINGNVDFQTITEDLEAMKKMGFGGFLMFDSRGYWDGKSHLVLPSPACEFMDETWRKNLKHSVKEAERIGLEMSLNISSSAGRMKGPWLLGADVPKRLVCKISPLKEKSLNKKKLSAPERKHVWEVANFIVKYDGKELKTQTEWLNAGDGLYTMSDVKGAEIGGKSVAAKEKLKALEVIDVSDRTKSSDNLEIELSEGKWALVQFFCTTMDDHDFDLDILDEDAVARYYKRFSDALKQDLGASFGKTLTHFYNVSWEGAVPTWTPGFEKFFANQTGYEIFKFMPVLAGFEMGKDGEKFMTDFRRARNACFKKNFYMKAKKLAEADGIKWHSESGGPWSRKPQVFGEADQFAFLEPNHMPQGEFWVIRNEQYLIKPISNAANIYGRKKVAVEAFTHMAQHWSAYPAILKRPLDKVFCDGGNFMIWHTFTCSPKKFGIPGVEYFAGTHINRNVTWHDQASEFLLYISRCQYMLQQGSPSPDFCVYVGDTPYQHWGHWKEKFSEESQTKIPQGYLYDILNNDAILNLCEVKNGKLHLKSGMSYSAMLVDLEKNTISQKALEKILEFKKAGLPVICVGKKPENSAGLDGDANYIKTLGDELFKNSDKFEDYFSSKASAKILPAFSGPFDAVQRSGKDFQIYFVSGSGKGTQIFRAQGIPEIWDPVAGKRFAPQWEKLADGRISVNLNLPENGSVFLVFNKNPDKNALPQAWKNLREILSLDGSWEVHFEENRGAPERETFRSLQAWNEHENFGIRHFSGTAEYRKFFTLKNLPNEKNIFLDLGKVFSLAEVEVNGINCGIAWTSPWRVDISKALKSGENKISIKVTNTWVNRMIGDASLPPSERITQSNMALDPEKVRRPYCGFTAKDKLHDSGLLGPVKIVAQ